MWWIAALLVLAVVVGGLLGVRVLLSRLTDARQPRDSEAEQRNSQVVTSTIYTSHNGGGFGQ
jgi:hypothetical protein